MADDDASTERRLRLIADALGIPPESLADDPPEQFDGSQECLRLWRRIGTAEGRRQALAYLREIAERQD